MRESHSGQYLFCNSAVHPAFAEPLQGHCIRISSVKLPLPLWPSWLFLSPYFRAPSASRISALFSRTVVVPDIADWSRIVTQLREPGLTF